MKIRPSNEIFGRNGESGRQRRSITRGSKGMLSRTLASLGSASACDAMAVHKATETQDGECRGSFIVLLSQADARRD